MATLSLPRHVLELSVCAQDLLRQPLRSAPGICATCLTPCPGHQRCHRCASQPAPADAVLPISYSFHDGPLHAVLRDYKQPPVEVARQLQVILAAVLWRFLEGHEACLADCAGVGSFGIVTVVPSCRRASAARHPLCSVVGALAGTEGRYERLLRSPPPASSTRAFSVRRFSCRRRLSGDAVLLVDDTWTTGAHAQSAADALKRSGAGAVGVLVIGRHVHLDYGENQRWLSTSGPGFDWGRCARCRRRINPAKLAANQTPNASHLGAVNLGLQLTS